MVRAPLLCFCAALALGCHGQPVEPAAPADGAVDGAVDGSAEVLPDAGGEAASCAPIAGNLVPNPSFEETNTAGLLTGWLRDPIDGLTQRTGGAAHCEHWAELKMPAAVSSAFYWGQEFVVATAPPKGAKVLFTAWVRTLDGQNAGLLLLTGIVSTDSAVADFTVPADGSWKLVAVEWTVPTDGQTRFFVDIGSNLAKPRSIGVDQFSFVVQP